MDMPVDPPNADLTAFSALTTETLLWNPALFTPIAAQDMRAGKVYKVTAGGIITLPATTGSLMITPRAGLLVSSPTLGASGALLSPGATTNRPWLLEFYMTVRAIAAAGGAASTVIGWGKFVTQGLLTSGAPPFELTFGGTVASVDAAAAQGIAFTGIWGTTAGSLTPQGAFIQSLN